ncbi:endonuclease/exonuclease/phosphatase family protein [Sinomicrobium sp.]
MTILQIISIVLSSFFVFATLASRIRWDNWWIRIFDFPRVQLWCMGVIGLIFTVYSFSSVSPWLYIISAVVVLLLVYQGVKIWPYTPLHRKEVYRFKGKEDKNNRIAVLVSNVLTPNRNAYKLLQLVDRKQPDIVLTLESDSWWEEQLAPLEKHYPYTVKIPLDNLYGMHLYSKLELEEAKTMYLVKDDIPSIEAYVQLNSGKRVKIYCLHPMPPSPTESDTSTDRDAELLLVGKKISKRDETTLVFGDLNDVAWSNSTVLFRKISGLLDPRIGRGMFSTFHAGYFFLRWPLDHLFHSNDFMLNNIKRLPSIGSDHFPIYVDLQYKPIAEKAQKEPEADREDRELADEKIEKAEPVRKKDNTQYL